MKTRIDLGIDKFLLDYYKNEFDYMETYFKKLSDSVNSEKGNLQSLADSLRARGASDDYIADTLDEDSFNVDFFEVNTYNFAIIFLYSECEKILKQDYGILTNKSSKKLFRFEDAKKLYREEGIDLSTLSQYAKFDELRILNNCIKHDGYPNNELCTINPIRWNKTNRIELKDSEIQEFLNCAKQFFDELVPLIETKNNERIVKEDIDLILSVCQDLSSKKTESEQKAIEDVLIKLHKL